MTVSVRQYKLAHNTTLSNNPSVTLDSAPVQGNLLLFIAMIDKSATITSPATWTQRINQSNPDLSYYAGSKVAGASESQTINIALGTSRSSRLFVVEIQGDWAFGQQSVLYSGASPTLPSQSSGTTPALASSSGIGLAFWGADSTTSIAAGSGAGFTNSYSLEAFGFDDPVGNSGIPGFAFGFKNGPLTQAGEQTNFQYTIGGVAVDQMVCMVFTVTDVGTPAATVSSPTPSGTIATATTATIGATTNQASGTAYVAIDTVQANITALTTTASVIATADGSAAVSSTSISIPLTGLLSSTTYYYAIGQRNANGDSNVQYGSFTTAAGTRQVSVTLRNGTGALMNAQTLRFFTYTDNHSAPVDGGTTGLSITSNASGVFNLTNLQVPAGAGKLKIVDPAGIIESMEIDVTYVASV